MAIFHSYVSLPEGNPHVTSLMARMTPTRSVHAMTGGSRRLDGSTAAGGFLTSMAGND